MACGKPIVGSINGATANLINESKCGVCVRSEDSMALADAIKNLTTAQLKEFGKNAREYYLEHFKKDEFMKALTEELNKHC